MLRTSLRMHPKMDKFIGQPEVQDAIESLIRGAPVESVPISIKHQVISGLNARRKDAILHHQDSLSNKLDIIIGEITNGPDKYVFDGPIDPRKTVKARTLDTPETLKMKQTTTRLIKGEEAIDNVDVKTRQSIGPLLKTNRVLELSRANYSQSSNIDRQIDNCHQYSVDSRRLAPKLQQVSAIEKKLADARMHYEETRRSCYQRRKEYTQLEKAAEIEMEKKLNEEMLEYGSHLPTTLPLEYQKFSSKVLDAKEKEEKGARLRMYDEAAANRAYRFQREREEIERNNEAFARAFNANKQVLIKSQQQKREGFKEVWRRKKDKVTAELAAEMEQAKRAVENLERELAYARNAEYNELGRIRSSSAIQAHKIPASYSSFK